MPISANSWLMLTKSCRSSNPSKSSRSLSSSSRRADYPGLSPVSLLSFIVSSCFVFYQGFLYILFLTRVFSCFVFIPDFFINLFLSRVFFLFLLRIFSLSCFYPKFSLYLPKMFQSGVINSTHLPSLMSLRPPSEALLVSFMMYSVLTLEIFV